MLVIHSYQDQDHDAIKQPIQNLFMRDETLLQFTYSFNNADIFYTFVIHALTDQSFYKLLSALCTLKKQWHGSTSYADKLQWSPSNSSTLAKLTGSPLRFHEITQPWMTPLAGVYNPYDKWCTASSKISTSLNHFIPFISLTLTFPRNGDMSEDMSSICVVHCREINYWR